LTVPILWTVASDSASAVLPKADPGTWIGNYHEVTKKGRPDGPCSRP
jgi:hypothetical protein